MTQGGPGARRRAITGPPWPGLAVQRQPPVQTDSRQARPASDRARAGGPAAVNADAAWAAVFLGVAHRFQHLNGGVHRQRQVFAEQVLDAELSFAFLPITGPIVQLIIQPVVGPSTLRPVVPESRAQIEPCAQPSQALFEGHAVPHLGDRGNHVAADAARRFNDFSLAMMPLELHVQDARM